MLTASSPAASSISAELGLKFRYHFAMQTLTPLDWTILAVLVLSTVMAFIHGCLVEVCNFLDDRCFAFFIAVEGSPGGV